MKEQKKAKLFSLKYWFVDFVRVTGAIPTYLWYRPKIVYESKSTHETVNTWNAEANILAMAEEAACQAEAEAQRQAEAEAAAEAQRQAEEAAAAAAAAAAEQGGQQNTDADGCIPDDEEIFN